MDGSKGCRRPGEPERSGGSDRLAAVRVRGMLDVQIPQRVWGADGLSAHKIEERGAQCDELTVRGIAAAEIQLRV